MWYILKNNLLEECFKLQEIPGVTSFYFTGLKSPKLGSWSNEKTDAKKLTKIMARIIMQRFKKVYSKDAFQKIEVEEI